MAEPMRAPVIEFEPEQMQPKQVNERKAHSSDAGRGLMTPARRAALDALERELNEFLKTCSR